MMGLAFRVSTPSVLNWSVIQDQPKGCFSTQKRQPIKKPKPFHFLIDSRSCTFSFRFPIFDSTAAKRIRSILDLPSSILDLQSSILYSRQSPNMHGIRSRPGHLAGVEFNLGPNSDEGLDDVGIELTAEAALHL